MTQMMLFDSPTLAPAAPVVATPAPATQTEPVVDAPQVAGAGEMTGKLPEHQPGLNHMGDLARLVILRYQLVAQRRAALQAKSASGIFSG